MNDLHNDRILILDFGSQFTQLIARRVREAGVYCEIHSCDSNGDFIRDWQPSGVILSGGPESVLEQDTLKSDETVFELGVPVLGICYGMQTMAAQLGGRVHHTGHSEFGYAEVRARGHSALLKDIEDRVTEEGFGMLDVWMSHGDSVEEMPAGFKLIASTESAPVAGMADEERCFYGLQFHPEVTHTRQGARIITRFVRDICGCQGLWTADNIIDDQVRKIREQVGEEEVILGLSGGVDSSVVAAILHKAIGEQLT
ncbi:MAG: glutamine-hydrolyzing GMP synthase, partial [Gammaproteobacteria bacterium]|nr:glutamine-hydrolyzing GMP synthase [Gammaproteobacteria bacterium]